MSRGGLTVSNRFLLWLRDHGDKWNERTGTDRLVRAGLWTSWQILATWSHPLARGERRQAVADFVRWMRRQRSEPWVRVRHPIGAVLTGPASVIGRYTSLGLFEYPEQAFIADVIRPGDVVLDVGAFVGSYAIPLAARGAIVHAFEPVPDARTHLQRNLDANGFNQRVQIYPLALATSPGRATMTMDYASGNRIIEDEESDTTTASVEVASLDSWSEERDLGGLLLIKIDAEGTDEEVVAGAHQLIRRYDPALIVEYWGGGARLRGALSELGLLSYRYDPSRQALVPLGEAAGSGNVIACSKARAGLLGERLATAPAREFSRPVLEWLSSPPEATGREDRSPNRAHQSRS